MPSPLVNVASAVQMLELGEEEETEGRKGRGRWGEGVNDARSGKPIPVLAKRREIPRSELIRLDSKGKKETESPGGGRGIWRIPVPHSLGELR